MPEASQRDLERIGDAAASLLSGTRGAGAGQLDDEPLPADGAELLDRQSVLTGEQHERGDVPWPGANN